ncbi:MAG: putative lipid II flippase FtsW [Lachnospiraceae bacterium]|nr:putative lipid II flippase FtsW [Lachnospiraceae bacterium]
MAIGTAEIKQFTKKQVRRVVSSGFDFNLLFILATILGFGLIMVYSASSYVAIRDFDARDYFFKKQLIWDLIGLVAMTIMIFIPYKLFNAWNIERWIMYIAAVVLPLLVIPFGKASHNATRWVELGPISFQPAEISKILMIIFFASWLAGIKEKINTWKYIGISVGFILPVSGIIYGVTDNLSSALIIAMICILMIFVASNDIKKYVVIGAGLAVLVAIVIIVVYNADLSDGASFRVGRIYTWLHPGTAADTTGHQTIQALYAIGNGGIMGKGLGQSVQKISALPEPQNDMIFAVICEELGVVGAMALIVMYALLLYRIYSIARETKNRFAFMLVVGVMCHIGVQAILNIAVATNSMPNTGVSLPFVSYGGSSAVFLLAEVGMVLCVNRINSREAKK